MSIKELSQSASYTNANGATVGPRDVYAEDVYANSLTVTTLSPSYIRQPYSGFACFNPTLTPVTISNTALNPTVLSYGNSPNQTPGSTTNMSILQGNVYDFFATVYIGSRNDLNPLVFSLCPGGDTTQNILNGAVITEAALGYMTLQSRIVFGTNVTGGTTPSQCSNVISYQSTRNTGVYVSQTTVGSRAIFTNILLLQSMQFGAYQDGGSNTIALAQLQWKLVAN